MPARGARKVAWLSASCALGAAALAVFFGARSHSASAADHLDSATVTAEPTADLTDLFAWTNEDADKVNLVLNVSPNAGEDAAFPTSVQYVFHVASRAAYGDEDGSETKVICQFYNAENIECWAGDEYVTGNPSSEAGITSESGKLRVFAGLRNDPFFFELAGFNLAVSTAVAAVEGGLDVDPAGCPAVDEATSGVLVGMLQGQDAEGNGEATDFFAGHNVLSLAIQIDRDVVNSDGDLLAVWASTHRAQ